MGLANSCMVKRQKIKEPAKSITKWQNIELTTEKNDNILTRSKSLIRMVELSEIDSHIHSIINKRNKTEYDKEEIKRLIQLKSSFNNNVNERYR